MTRPHLHLLSLFFVLLLTPGYALPLSASRADTLAGDRATEALLAAQYFRNGDYERAVVLYESLFAHEPLPVIYGNYLACLLALDEMRRAERVVRTMMRRHPGDPRYVVDLGWVHALAGNQRQSRRQFDRLIRDVPPEKEAVVALARAFEERELYERALETYLLGRRQMGDRPALHLYLASLHATMGNHRAMMTEYIAYLEYHPEDREKIKGVLQDELAADTGFNRSDALREVLLSRSRQYPDNALFPEMLLWLSLQQLDFPLALTQARALDRRFRQQGELILDVARLSASHGSFAVAARAYRELMDRGEESPFYMEALTGFLDARFQEAISSIHDRQEHLLELEQEFQQAIDRLGVNPTTVRLLRNLARLQAFYLDKVDGAVELLQRTLDIPGVHRRVRAESQTELADILVLRGEVWDALLLYAEVDRMFRDDPLGHEARYKNARLSYYIGEFDWAKAQLDVLKAATHRLIANNAMRLSLRIQDHIGLDGDTRALQMYARAELLRFMNRPDQALLVLDSIAQAFPTHDINDEVLYARAEIMLERGSYDTADSLLARIVSAYGRGLLAADALFLRAELHEKVFGDPDRAMQLYQQLMSTYPGSLHVMTARQRFRALRGDLIN